MDFLQYISTPPGHTEASPLKTPVTLTAGRLVGGFLYFPRGPAGLLHFIAKIGEHQILPYNTGQNYRLNGAKANFHLKIDLEQPPYIIDCLTWNDSTSLSHACTVVFFLEPSKKLRNVKAVVKSLYDATNGYLKRGQRKV